MSRTVAMNSRVFWFAAWAPAAMLAAPAGGQTTDKPVLGLAQVVGNDVYVRSGDSLNHYPVAKLSAGDRVTIVGERGEWYEILPPAGTFTWVSAQYVDSPDNRAGVVNGDNVRARAGSSLPEWEKNKYAIQAMLPKGTAVTILESHPDGYLKIEPPPGATLWINRKLVEPLTGAPGEVDHRPVGPAVNAGTSPGEGSTTVADPDLEASPFDAPAVETPAAPSPFAYLPPSPRHQELQRIDEATRQELTKPVFERRFEEVLARYQAVAGQNEDEVSRQYAEARIRQVQHMDELIDAARATQKLDDTTETRRRELLEARMAIPEVPVPEPRGFDAQGELRVSALYPAGFQPERYRLVDPATPNGRTVGYVEIPGGRKMDVDRYLGRFVGVRASQTFLQPGGVDPVPIFIASELVVLQPGKAELAADVSLQRAEPPPEPMYLVP